MTETTSSAATGDGDYTGHVEPMGPSARRDLGNVCIVKVSVSEQDNNCYFVIDRISSSAVIIDAADNADRILEALSAQGVEARKVELLVTTHQHWDHHRALPELVEATAGRTMAGAEDADALPVGVNQTLLHGDELAFGQSSFEVIALRGHTPGSVALLYRDPDGTAHLFTGDSLFPGGPGKTNSEQEFNQLMDDLDERVFAGLPDDTWIYPGHGDDTTLGAERPQLQAWRERGW
ncbi:MBL fold metallo-hydrolase [Saxibacter everestensis]|uniref:MBL fold metallo-hydrolase n=1 Tax=Saxibacter everestensis TaxID=2909229 RepID=A0ABY8QZ72_9MICO|nr:MBL fold metallo-hydrolase [Brevibacteriaceae bacterium ZFBP1038]